LSSLWKSNIDYHKISNLYWLGASSGHIPQHILPHFPRFQRDIIVPSLLSSCTSSLSCSSYHIGSSMVSSLFSKRSSPSSIESFSSYRRSSLGSSLISSYSSLMGSSSSISSLSSSIGSSSSMDSFVSSLRSSPSPSIGSSSSSLGSSSGSSSSTRSASSPIVSPSDVSSLGAKVSF